MKTNPAHRSIPSYDSDPILFIFNYTYVYVYVRVIYFKDISRMLVVGSALINIA